MLEHGPEYDTDNMILYARSDNINVGAFVGNECIAFACLIRRDSQYLLTMTWNNGTKIGREAYADGIDYIHDIYSPLIIVPRTIERFNKLKRIYSEELE